MLSRLPPRNGPRQPRGRDGACLGLGEIGGEPTQTVLRHPSGRRADPRPDATAADRKTLSAGHMNDATSAGQTPCHRPHRSRQIGGGGLMPLKTSPWCPFATAWERRCSTTTSHDPHIFTARACPASRQAATVPGQTPLQGRRLLP